MEKKVISAVLLAAGHSRRMGAPKMTLPWGDTTVIGKIVSTLVEAGVNRITVVAGDNLKQLLEALQGYEVNLIVNENHEKGEMLSSVQAGLHQLGNEPEAALIVLGDQPQISVEVVKLIIGAYDLKHSSIIVPSYQMHRGHPWLIGRDYWSEIIDLRSPLTLRDFLNQHKDQISYVKVATASILDDLDTPQEYQQHKPTSRD